MKHRDAFKALLNATNYLFFYSVSSGEGKHWFALLRTSQDTYEVFDSLGISLRYIKQNIPFHGVFEFNTFPVQCSDSYYCGGFVVYYLIERYSNLDIEFEELINDIFGLNCEENQSNVKSFLHLLKKK